MNMLETITAPRHHSQYPGELCLFLGGVRNGRTGPWQPGNLTIHLAYGDLTEKLVLTIATAGTWQLLVKDGEIATLHHDGPDVHLADLATFTGVPLAAELEACFEKMRAGFDPAAGYATRWARFANPGQYNDLMVGLCFEHTAATRRTTLEALLARWGGDADAQEAWYRQHGPDLPGETWVQYNREQAGFASYGAVYRSATSAQLAAWTGR